MAEMLLPPLNTPIAHDGSSECPVHPETRVKVTIEATGEPKEVWAENLMWPAVTTYTIIARAPADRIAELEAVNAAMFKALMEIAQIKERKENKYPADWRDQIAACPECQRYKDHPIQRGICDTHRKPIYAQESHDAHETEILGYRAKRIAEDAVFAARATLKGTTDV